MVGHLWNTKSFCLALVFGAAASVAAAGQSASHASPATQSRFTQSSSAQTPVAPYVVQHSYYSGGLAEPRYFPGTNFYFLGTVSSPDRVQQHSNELVIPDERVHERPGDRIQSMPRIGEE